MRNASLSRRDFVMLAAASPVLFGAKKNIPIGIQQTAVGKNIQQDLEGTLRALAKMGYENIEFSANQFMNWTPARAKEIRTLMDGINLKCHSTHNEIVSFSGDGLSKSLELNGILGSRTLVSVRGPGPTGGRGAAKGPATPPTVDQWKHFSEQLSSAADKIRAAKMTLGFHNHDIEFKPVDGTLPMDILAANKDITSFHLNIGLCLKGGGDPVKFINQCPGRIQSLLIQDFEGKADWKKILPLAENKGRLQFYLIQRTDGLFLVDRQGDDLLDFAQKDLEYFKKLRG